MMRRLLQNRLSLQLLLTSIAAVSLTTLSVLLILESVESAESVVVQNADRTLAAALHELRQQANERADMDSTWLTLPLAAKNVSLTGITGTVLRAFDGVEGGYFLNGQLVGYAFPTHDTGGSKTDLPVPERPLILQVIGRAAKASAYRTLLIHGRNNLLLLGALPDRGSGGVVWAMKRIVSRPANARRNLLLGILIAAALSSIGGALMTGTSLVRGVRQIQRGLASLENDFEFQLRDRNDEFGSITRAINRMAATRRRLEAVIRKEDRLRALGRMAAGIAHEIRNPLNSISLTVQMLELRLARGTLRRDDLQIIRKEVDRLNSLLSDLLHLQQARQPERERRELRPVLEHCINLISPQAALQQTDLVLEADPGLMAQFDETRLQQTIVNLLLNALEVSAQGQHIVLRAQPVDERVTITVQDQGPGLDEKGLEHLFEPLYTTKANGVGLGLAVSRELMRSQGGDLHYVPNGQGACFSIELPKESQ